MFIRNAQSRKKRRANMLTLDDTGEGEREREGGI